MYLQEQTFLHTLTGQIIRLFTIIQSNIQSCRYKSRVIIRSNVQCAATDPLVGGERQAQAARKAVATQ